MSDQGPAIGQQVDRAVERILDYFLANDESADTIETTSAGIWHVVTALRSLPVEQRMEAMGMTRWDDVAGYEPGSMVPVFIERDTDV